MPETPTEAETTVAQIPASNGIVSGPCIVPAGVEREFATCSAASPKELSLVIPVFNGSLTVQSLVERIIATLAHVRFEIILVNDGSTDNSEAICNQLADRYRGQIEVLHLARNFGEHNAVLAGLAASVGNHVAVLDDDGQHRPEDVLVMLAWAKRRGLEVVYGRYRTRRHSVLRILGSKLHNRLANIVLKKPRQLYLSSFKLMSRFVVDEVVKYAGPYPYLDGLILRTTRNVGQIDVHHETRLAGQSGYTLPKLVGLWLNMFLGFSTLPLRLCGIVGLGAAALSLLLLVAIVIDKVWFTPHLTAGIPTVLACVVLFSGIQLMVLGLLGEYVGRLFLHQAGMPAYVVRYRRQSTATPGGAQSAGHPGDPARPGR